MQKFSEWYQNIQEAANKPHPSTQKAGKDLSSKAAIDNAPEESEKLKKDRKGNGPEGIDIPVAGKDYYNEK